MKVKINIPGELSDIKLSQYQQFVKTTKDSEDDKWIRRQYVAVFCKLNDKIVGKIRKKDFDSIVSHVNNLLVKEPPLQEIIHHNGQKLGFIPKLEDITLDEQADIETWLQDVDTWDKAMNVLYRPVKGNLKDKYLIEDYEGDGKGLDVSLDVALGAVLFFYNLMNDCLTFIPNYIKDNRMQIQPILEKNGIGITTFTHSLKAILDDLKKSVSYGYMSAWCFWHLKRIKTNWKRRY